MARGISRPDKMACIGGSNGGLLVGNMITRPVGSTVFGAAVCQVPLLDMKRYSKLLAGASWMAEYEEEYLYTIQCSEICSLRTEKFHTEI